MVRGNQPFFQSCVPECQVPDMTKLSHSLVDPTLARDGVSITASPVQYCLITSKLPPHVHTRLTT